MAESYGDKGAITAISIYKDLSGLPQICFSEKDPNVVSSLSALTTAPMIDVRVKAEPDENVEEDMDDIDALLYGNDDDNKRK